MSYLPPDERALGWVEDSLRSNARVVARSRLVGGLTADMDRVTIRSDTGSFDVVLRRWSNSEWGEGFVDRETAALTALRDHDIPAPELLTADRSGECAGVPCLLMTAVPGEPLLNPVDMADCLRQLASMLVRIHQLAPTGWDDSDPHGAGEDAEHGWISDPGLARAATEAVADAVATKGERPQVFVHGDYQQLNILWQNNQLASVVDWTYTGRGPREVDVGHCRLALTLLFSSEAAETFLRLYEAEAGVRLDPRADIRALLAFNLHALDLVPRQVAGRAPVDPLGMPGRVEALLRSAVDRLH